MFNLQILANRFARALKEVTSKRSKTDADHELIGNIEWLGGWYYKDGACEFAVGSNEVIVGDHGALILRFDIIWAMLVNSAKKNKLGNQFKAGVFVDNDVDLEFEGKRDLMSMMADDNLRIVTPEKVGTAKVMRTRPYLKKWQVSPIINYDDTVVNKSQIEQALEIGGRIIGLCERRPSYGRFACEVLKK